MVLVAMDQKMGTLIKSIDVNYTKSIMRKKKIEFYCAVCNNEVIFINAHKRIQYKNSNKKYINVTPYFRHVDNTQDTECENDISTQNIKNINYTSELLLFVDKWIECVKSEYKFAKRIGNVIDIINQNGDNI